MSECIAVYLLYLLSSGSQHPRHHPVQVVRSQLRPSPSQPCILGPGGKATCSWRPELPPPQRHSVPAAARWVTNNKNTKTQPLEMKDVSVSMKQTTCVLEMRSAGLGEGGWKFPWGGLCLKFNMLFLSLKAPATASSCFVILAPLSVWWM